MGLRAKEIVLGLDAQKAYERLKENHDHESLSIVRRVKSLELILLADCQYGEVVKKGRIPTPLRLKHGLENLYVCDLPSYWRLLCTIVRVGNKPSIVVVEVVNHDTYNKWFPSHR